MEKYKTGDKFRCIEGYSHFTVGRIYTLGKCVQHVFYIRCDMDILQKRTESTYASHPFYYKNDSYDEYCLKWWERHFARCPHEINKNTKVI